MIKNPFDVINISDYKGEEIYNKIHRINTPFLQRYYLYFYTGIYRKNEKEYNQG